jgi:hypothetical protein
MPGRGQIMDVEKKPPVLSHKAKRLLLLAEKGTPDLLSWYIGIWDAWDEIPIINQQYAGGFRKCRLGDDVFLEDSSSGFTMLSQKMTTEGVHLENGEKIKDPPVEYVCILPMARDVFLTASAKHFL